MIAVIPSTPTTARSRRGSADDDKAGEEGDGGRSEFHSLLDVSLQSITLVKNHSLLFYSHTRCTALLLFYTTTMPVSTRKPPLFSFHFWVPLGSIP
mmetsp:Transcript_15721/g.33213  ORF Transcript_15721/g.33213 Transcript_15721/m.33213 type:complete len:96 (-) Transcript_15721:28-315(-)